MKQESIIIKATEAGGRIDVFLSKRFPDYSRNYFTDLIKSGEIRVNQQIVKQSYGIKEFDRIDINFKEKEAKRELLPEKINLDIIYEDKNVIVINKQAGLVVHPAAGHQEGTLVNALLDYFPGIKNAVYDTENEVSRIRPGLVHRLDRDTSGVLIVAKNAVAMHSLSRQIQNRNVKKTYLAICSGWPKNHSGEIISYLGRHPKNRKLMANIGPEKGKEAITEYQVLKYYTDKNENKISLIQFNLKTGRTHQIRVQISDLGHPILGDSFYGNKLSEKTTSQNNVKRQLLHAKKLSITLPGDNKQTEFEAPTPEDFLKLMKDLEEVG